MHLRTKLLLSFLALSMLIIIVGMVFYLQLRDLIDPLTPQSIPKSIEQVEASIEKNNLVYKLIYQQELTRYNMDKYVLTGERTFLQDYYLNQELIFQIMEKMKAVDPKLSAELAPDINALYKEKSDIIKQQTNRNKNTVIDTKKLSLIQQKVNNKLKKYLENYDVFKNEEALVTVKLASKNTKNILNNSIRTAIVIFVNALIFSILIAIFSANTFSRPIALLCKDMDFISSENLETPLRKTLINSKGEIGELAHSFKRLIDRLRSTTVSRDMLLLEVQKRIQSEDNLRKTAQRLEISNRELDQFAYSASHDLRAPLKGIENLSEWILEDCSAILPEESKKHLDLLIRRVRRLDLLIEGILNYSRAVKSEGVELVDLESLLNDIVDNLVQTSSITIQIHEKMPSLRANRAMITQVFSNLINNAIKFHGQAKGNIEIGFKGLKTTYQFFVKDDGPGIDPNFHHKIFEIFQTLQPRDSIEGAGIGLALVKKIVENQGGKVWVESALGEGATFFFTWPKVYTQSKIRD